MSAYPPLDPPKPTLEQRVDDLTAFVREQLEQRIAHIDGELDATQRKAADPRVSVLISCLKQAQSFDELAMLLEKEGL